MLDDVCRSQTHNRTRHRICNVSSSNSVLTLTPSSTGGMIQSKVPGEFNQHCANVSFDSIYTITEDLCRGRFSLVKKCLKKGTNDQVFAAKIVKRRNIQQALNELRILQLTQKHPHFITLHHIFDLPSEAIFIFEYAKEGDLQLILQSEGFLDEPQASHVIKQVIEAIRFLHEHQVVHLDIKPQNVLVIDKWPTTHVKLCDFGLSRKLTNQCLLEISGTTDFLAPEVVNYEPLTCATDMWSIGVLIYVLVTGHTPFGGATVLETQNNITHCELDFPPELFEKKSKKCLDLIRKLIVRSPKQRLTANESLRHQWICFNEETFLTNSLDDDEDDDDSNMLNNNDTDNQSEQNDEDDDDNNQLK